MGKIFGISDLPVSTIDKAIQSTNFEKKVIQNVTEINSQQADVFIGKTSKKYSKSFLNMRNGFGKLMSHFSKKLIK